MASSSNSSTFLRVPIEVRLDIYRNLLVSSCGIDLDGIPVHRHTRIPDSNRQQQPVVHVNILCTSKQVHDEASAILYGENVFALKFNSRFQIRNTLNAHDKFDSYRHLIRRVTILEQGIPSVFPKFNMASKPPMMVCNSSLLTIESSAFRGSEATTQWMAALGQWLIWLQPEQLYIKVNAHTTPITPHEEDLADAFDVVSSAALYGRWAIWIRQYRRRHDAKGNPTFWRGGIWLERVAATKRIKTPTCMMSDSLLVRM